jgi:hypothetical protein
VLSGFLVAAGAAQATAPSPPDQQVLDAAASWMANQAVTVRCLGPGEKDSPASVGAWAYVFLWQPVIYADDEVCEGALAIVHHDTSVAWWQQALGALVLTHESFHLRLNMGNRGNEAATECRAIRHVRYMLERLGASPKLVAKLLPWALALHWRLAATVPAYYAPHCNVPNPY